MTEGDAGQVPDWDLADRLIKARRVAKVKQSEMAAELGVTRQAVSLFETGDVVPRLAYLKVWAIRCGVPYDWLRGRDSNPQPSVVPPPFVTGAGAA